MLFSKKLITLSISTILAVGSSGLLANESDKTVRIGKKMATTNVVGSPLEYVNPVINPNKLGNYLSSQSKENLDEQYKASISLNKSALESKERSPKRFEKNASHLYIYDAAVLLKSDIDGDGYYSEIRVDFDVDANYAAYYDVYAELYIREEGTSDWTHYFTTDVFEIYYDDSDDDYHVTTSFNEGFPTGKYEIAIDLFEYGYAGVVDSLEAYDDPDLGNLPLEDSSYEQIGPNTNVSISTVKTEIFTDNDGDGYYQDFKISFDADVTSGERSIVAKLFQKSGSSDWQFEAESQIYTITGTSTDDTIAFEGAWQSGYATGNYDFKIELFDSATNEFLASASNDFGPLVDVPLEDAAKDTNSGGSTGGGSSASGSASTTSSGSGGGSWNILGLTLLAGLAWLRKKL